MVDAAHEKEKIAKDTIKTLQQEINRLTVLVEQEVVVSKAEVQRWVCDVNMVIVSQYLKIQIYMLWDVVRFKRCYLVFYL